MTASQRALLFVLLGKLHIGSREDQLATLSYLTGRALKSRGELSRGEAKAAINHLTAVLSWPDEERLAEVAILTRPVEDPWAEAGAA